MILDTQLITYIQNQILPQYSKLDEAHGISHIEYVINKSLKLACQYEADINMVYTIAAFHDIGMLQGRDEHEIISGNILESDNFIKAFFSDTQIYVMKEAISQHRASFKGEPRSIYGKIISQADRNFDVNSIINRAVIYGKSKYPCYNYVQQYDRVFDYLTSKYGKDGYLKIWLKFEDDENQLKEVRSLLSSKDKFQKLFDMYYFQK